MNIYNCKAIIHYLLLLRIVEMMAFNYEFYKRILIFLRKKLYKEILLELANKRLKIQHYLFIR